MRQIRRKFSGLALFAWMATAATVPAPPARAASAEPLRLEVDVSERKLTVFRNGKAGTSYPVAVGQAKHPTPRGTFKIERVVWNPDWVPPPKAVWAKGKTEKQPGHPENPMQGAKLFFKYPGYYIHGTNATHSLGKAASHGCIRMRPSDAEALARLVQEHGGVSKPESWYRRIIRSKTEKQEIRLARPISFVVRD